MLWTLIRADLRSVVNAVRERRGRRRAIGMLVAALVGGPFFVAASFAVGYGMARLGTDPVTVFAASFTAVTVVVLVVQLPSVIESFFADRRLLLLALAPIRPLDVYLSRLLLASRIGWALGVLLVAQMLGFGVATGAGGAFYVVGLAGLVLVVASAISLQVIALSFLLRVAPASRARDVATLVAALLGALLYLGWFAVVGGGRPAATGLGPYTEVGRRLGWLPTAWPARALAGVLAGDPGHTLAWLAATAALCAALGFLAWVGYRRAFVLGVGVFGEGGGTSIGRRRTRRARRDGAERPASPVGALLRKDLLSMRRDVRRLAGVLPSLAVAVVYPVLFSRSISGTGLGFWGSMWGCIFAPFLLSNVLALPAVALEGRAMLLLRLAGTPLWTLLRAKLSYTIPAVAVVGVPGALVVAVLHQATGAQLVAVAAASLWVSAGLAAIGTGAGALAPNFDAPDPRRAVGFTGVIAGNLADAGFLACSGGGVGLGVLGWWLGSPWTAPLVAAGVVVAAAGVALVVLLLAISMRRLARLDYGSI
ncbi:MAG: hypothetical protein J2P40_03495 [Candidatus Dormibacteraeota bacterium]|nr:hypothetical protein [Candidatus Dormibacteraeota bacterium]MBO0760318.1 hypothetical protein [Candidatus Dormibacteraeota bacterium]